MTIEDVIDSLRRLQAIREGPSREVTAWISWAIEAERLFALTLSESDPVLKRYRMAVERYIERKGPVQELTWGLLGAFDACKSVLDHSSEQEVEARLTGTASGTASSDPPQYRPAIRLFISHASTDADLAELVVKLLRSSLGVAPTAIRCTSVDGYRLPGGADVDDEIRREVQQAEAVVGILSGRSLASLYVAFELGARWGVNRPLIPLTAPGFQPSEIKGPLTGKNALAADNASQLHDLVSEVGKQLDIVPNPASSYQSEVNAITHFADTAAATPEAATQPSKPPVVRDHVEIKILKILFASNDALPAERLAGDLGGLPAQKVRYFLDRLQENGNLVDRVLYMGSPSEYFITSQGRAFLVENGLV